MFADLKVTLDPVLVASLLSELMKPKTLPSKATEQKWVNVTISGYADDTLVPV